MAAMGRVTLTGRIAWLMWLLIHVFSLIGFRNRVAVLFNWVGVTCSRSARRG